MTKKKDLELLEKAGSLLDRTRRKRPRTTPEEKMERAKAILELVVLYVDMNGDIKVWGRKLLHRLRQDGLYNTKKDGEEGIKAMMHDLRSIRKDYAKLLKEVV